MKGIHAEDNATSETDVPVGQGLRYSPQVFTDLKYTAVVPHIEEEEDQAANNKFLGRYCEFCNKCGEMY